MSDKKRLKTCEDVIDTIGHPQECWDDHCAGENLQLSEDYLNLHLHIIIPFRVESVPEERVARTCFVGPRPFDWVGKKMPQTLKNRSALHLCGPVGREQGKRQRAHGKT